MPIKVPCASCAQPFDLRRKQLGYNFCLDCGDFQAREQRAGWTIVPTPKGHYTRITNKEELKDLNQKIR